VDGGVLLQRDRELRLQLQKALFADALNIHQLFDLFAEDSWRRVYAGELEVRPPGAPTTRPDTEEIGCSVALNFE
jgi:hypothetical protein